MKTEKSKLTVGTLVDWKYESDVNKMLKQLKKAIKKVLKTEKISNNRINTFSVTTVSLKETPSLTQRLELEEKVSKIHQEFAEKLKKHHLKELEYNGDSKVYSETIKALKLVVDKDWTSFHHGQINEAEDLINEIIGKSSVKIWDLDEKGIDRIIIGDLVSNVPKNDMVDVSDSIDELLITNLAKKFLPYSLLFVELALCNFQDLNRSLRVDMESFNQLPNILSQNMIGALSSLQESIKVLERQVWRLDELALDTVAELETMESEELMKWIDIDFQAIGAVVLETLAITSDEIREIKAHLRKTLRVSGETNLDPQSLETNFATILKVRSQIAKLRHWIHSFEVLPSFTTMSNGIAYEFVEGEEYSPTNGALIETTKLFKKFQRGQSTIYALRGIDLSINEGEFVVIRGPSGSGKTTLLNTISGLAAVDRGAVFFNDENILEMRDRKRTKIRKNSFSFIFQNYALIPHLTAFENTKVPLDLQGLSKGLQLKIQDLLEDVGIGQFSDHKPALLSGGQMQRLGIARALIGSPKVIFADEPTGDLDGKTSIKIMELLRKYHEETGVTIVLVTHDEEVAKYADREIYVQDGQVLENPISA